MKTCHLHIGMHKTGSSSIQNYLDKNRDELLKNGFYYAEMGSPNHSAPFLYSLRFEPEKDSEIASFNISSEELNRRVSLYKENLNESLNKEYTNIIFSAEAIIKLTEEELSSFKNYLLGYVDEIKVYCYVREPMPFTVSSFQQIIKTMPVFLDNQNLYPNYKSKLEKFEKIFGDTNYRLFARNSLLNSDVTADFCSWIGLPYLGAEETNNSLGALAVKFLYKFQHARNKIVVSQNSLELAENTLSKLPYNKVVLPTKEMAEMITDNTADFTWMLKLLKEKVPGIIFNIKDEEKLSYGNVYGFFSEQEKSLLIQLANSSPELEHYIKSETGLSIIELVSTPPEGFEGLEFYVRKIEQSIIQGWASYTSDNDKNVEFDIFLNNMFVNSIKADIKRDDLPDPQGSGRHVGYIFDFGKALTPKDLVTILIDGKVAFSGSF